MYNHLIQFRWQLLFTLFLLIQNNREKNKKYNVNIREKVVTYNKVIIQMSFLKMKNTPLVTKTVLLLVLWCIDRWIWTGHEIKQWCSLWNSSWCSVPNTETCTTQHRVKIMAGNSDSEVRVNDTVHTCLTIIGPYR